jgi:hypothetical protein
MRVRENSIPPCEHADADHDHFFPPLPEFLQ